MPEPPVYEQGAQEQRLAGRTVAVPESRELDVFAAMLERRGAKVVRCPLVAILDAPDPAPVLAWLRSFNAGEMDDLILLTGEGLRRLLSCIEKNEPALRPQFVAQLARVRKITRGPKPARALRDLGLRPDIAAETPTTQGVIDSLRGENLGGRTVGVQLYGLEPNLPLIHFLSGAGANVRTVAPYIYASQAADEAVRDLLTQMAAGADRRYCVHEFAAGRSLVRGRRRGTVQGRIRANRGGRHRARGGRSAGAPQRVGSTDA